MYDGNAPNFGFRTTIIVSSLWSFGGDSVRTPFEVDCLWSLLSRKYRFTFVSSMWSSAMVLRSTVRALLFVLRFRFVDLALDVYESWLRCGYGQRVTLHSPLLSNSGHKNSCRFGHWNYRGNIKRQTRLQKVSNTSAARSQYPLRKSMHMLVFAVTFLCK